MGDAKTRNMNNNINANKDIYPKNDTVINIWKQGLPQDNLSDLSLTKIAAILANLFGKLPLLHEYDSTQAVHKISNILQEHV